MRRNVIGLRHVLGVHRFAGQEIEEAAHIFRILRALQRDERRAAGHPRAPAGPAGIGDDDPVEVLADLLLHAIDLPAPREIEHHASVGEFLECIAVARSADTAPDLLRHRAVTVPVVGLLRHRLVAVVDRQVSLGIEDLRPLADRRACKPVAQ